MVRKPIVAGQFYPSDPIELKKLISSCFSSKLCPGNLPVNERTKDIIGVISPHAGYTFSGPCAASAYKEIAESRLPETFILLGLSHSGRESCISLEDWETPLGIVRNDKEFQKTLMKNLPVDEKAHESEHSIEVQLPFLQFVSKDTIDKIKIAPIITSPDIDYKEIADYIFNAVKKTGRKVIIIASSDFTHYGFDYGYIPFTDNQKENMYALDKGAIKLIEALEADKFLDYAEETGATICGKYPIAVLLELSKKLGAKRASLLQYYTSGDVIKDYSSAVGYASLKIK